MENDPEDLDLTFSVDEELFGQVGRSTTVFVLISYAKKIYIFIYPLGPRFTQGFKDLRIELSGVREGVLNLEKDFCPFQTSTSARFI